MVDMKKKILAMLGAFVDQLLIVVPKNNWEIMRQFSLHLSGEEISQEWKDKIIKYLGL
jgi:hypothetical protein